MKESLTGTPPMPPFLLRSSAIISAAAFAGTPKTEAGPDRKVVIPILISCGLFCARAELAKFATKTAAASAALRNRMAVLPGLRIAPGFRGRAPLVAQRYYNSLMLPALTPAWRTASGAFQPFGKIDPVGAEEL